MNLRKHAAGFAIFSIIVGSAIFINAYLSVRTVEVRSVLVSETISQAPVRERQPINFKVRQISLDLMNNKSYTELRLERQPGQPAPEKLWVTTVFFAPGHLGIVGTSKVEINRPFAEGDQSDYVATDSDSLLDARSALRTEYFARVYVSTDPSDYSDFPDEIFDRASLTDAVPVVIQWPNEKRRLASPVQKFIH